MTNIEYCAINLNARYRLKFKCSRDDTYVFRKNMFDFFVLIANTIHGIVLEIRHILIIHTYIVIMHLLITYCVIHFD